MTLASRRAMMDTAPTLLVQPHLLRLPRHLCQCRPPLPATPLPVRQEIVQSDASMSADATERDGPRLRGNYRLATDYCRPLFKNSRHRYVLLGPEDSRQTKRTK